MSAVPVTTGMCDRVGAIVTPHSGLTIFARAVAIRGAVKCDLENLGGIAVGNYAWFEGGVCIDSWEAGYEMYQ
jgi:hypothetical protein